MYFIYVCILFPWKVNYCISLLVSITRVLILQQMVVCGGKGVTQNGLAISSELMKGTTLNELANKLTEHIVTPVELDDGYYLVSLEDRG